MTISRRWAVLTVLASLACRESPNDTARGVNATPLTDSVSHEWAWEVGDIHDSPDDSATGSRFAVRAKQFRSGLLTVFLDSAPRSSDPQDDRTFVPVDSIHLRGLSDSDRFTRGCNYGTGPWKPRVGVLRDSVHERPGRPRYLWEIDTVNARMRALPTDSATCFIAGPD